MSRRKHDEHRLLPDATAAAAALRELADQVAEGALPTPAGPAALQDLERLRVALSPGAEGITLELQLRLHRPRAASPATRSEQGGTEGPRTRAHFKTVKKRLSRAWKALRDPLRKGALPDLARRRAFVELCAEMVAAARWDDPAFAAFLAEAEGLMTLDSPEAIEALVARLRELERACHGRYRGKGR